MTARILFVTAAMVSFSLACSDPRGDTPTAREVPEHEREADPPPQPTPAPTPAPEPAPEPQPTPGAETAVPPELLSPPAADTQAPARYSVELTTNEGPIVIEVTRAWAPAGADRFYTLVQLGYFDDVAFFRVIDGFMAQTGIHGDARVNGVWRDRAIPDDPPRQSNTRGMVSFATSGPNSRTTQFFINFGNNANLDGMGFAPFGRVRDMAIVDRIHKGYGEGAPRGTGPVQSRIQIEGNAYLRASFPELDYIQSARIL